jgi:hypothetical protein
MKPSRAPSFLREPFGMPTALSLLKGQESTGEDGLQVVPGATIFSGGSP